MGSELGQFIFCVQNQFPVNQVLMQPADQDLSKRYRRSDLERSIRQTPHSLFMSYRLRFSQLFKIEQSIDTCIVCSVGLTFYGY